MKDKLKYSEAKLANSENWSSELDRWLEESAKDLAGARSEKMELRDEISRLEEEMYGWRNTNRCLDRTAEVLRYQNELLENSFEIVRRQRDEAIRR